jgi:hypothetical protein
MTMLRLPKVGEQILQIVRNLKLQTVTITHLPTL